MLAAGLSQTQALGYLAQVPHESAVVACINSPSSVTLSGDVDAIDTLETLISADGKFARKVKVKTAYHSPHMRSVAQGYLERIGHISPLTNSAANGVDANKTVMFSSLTGKLVSPEELNAQYWVSNMCAPVEFSAALSALLAHTSQPAGGRGKKVPIRWGGLVELGPHAALQGPVQQIVTASSSKTAKDAVYMSMVLRGKDATETALAAAGQLWALGYDIDLSAVNGCENDLSVAGPKALTDLPPYPWNHAKGFWHEAYSTRSNRFPSAPRTDLLGVPVDLQNSLEPRWKNHLRISENPWIEDHRITGTILYPAAGMLVMAMEGALRTADPARKLRGFRFREVGFERGLVVTSGDEPAVETRLSLQPHKGIPGHFQFTLLSTITGTSWTKHCSGTLMLEYAATGVSEIEDSAVEPAWANQSELYKQLIADSTAEDVDVDTFYDQLETIGMEYGPLFRNLESLSAIPSLHAAYGAVLIPDTKSSMPANFEFPHVIHPATMDAIFHLLLAAFTDGQPADEAAVPYRIEDIFVAAEQPQGVGGRFHGYGQLATKSRGGRETVGDLIVSDDAWSGPKLTVKGFALRQVTSADGVSAAAAGGADALRKCARVEWSKDVDFIKNSEQMETPSEVYILLPSPASPQVLALSSALTGLLSSSNITVHSITLLSTSTPHLVSSHVISLLELESPLIYSWSEAQFTSFKSLVSSASHILWLTRGSLLQSWAGSVEFAPAQGLLRVLRNEYTLTTLPHLDLSTGFDPMGPGSADLVLDVWRASLAEGAEMEYAELDGAIHVPRAVEDAGFDRELQLASGSAKPVRRPIHGSGTALKLASSVDGRNYLWIEDEDAYLPLGPEQVEVEVEFVGLSASDSFDASHNDVVSREAVGVVSRCGEQVKSVVVGQRVAVFRSEACRTHVRQGEALVAALPAGMLPQEAATLPSAFVAAQYALLEVAGLARGQTVLLHSAASALGQAAVQIAQFVGAEVFALVTSKEEKDILVERYRISPARIFDSALRNFVTAIEQATEGRGVDAVFSSQPSLAVVPSLATLGDFGYFLDLSVSTPDSPQLSLPSSKHNASLVRIDMDRVVQAKPDVVKALFQRTFHVFCRSGVVGPVWPTTAFSVSDTSQALDALKAQHHGKVVLSLDKEASVLTLPLPAPKLILDKDATYVLAGGLGALGLDIADMMLEHGAGHLVFLSRSGGTKNEKDLESFSSRGANVEAFRCDVSDAESVGSVFDRLKSEGRVVKGVVQCAMVLEVYLPPPFPPVQHVQTNKAAGHHF